MTAAAGASGLVPGIVRSADAAPEDFSKALAAGLGVGLGLRPAESTGRGRASGHTSPSAGDATEHGKVKSLGPGDKRTADRKAEATDPVSEDVAQAERPAEVLASASGAAQTQLPGVAAIPLVQIAGPAASTDDEVAGAAVAASKACRKFAAGPLPAIVEGPAGRAADSTLQEPRIAPVPGPKGPGLTEAVKETGPVSGGPGRFEGALGVIVEGAAGVSHTVAKEGGQNAQAALGNAAAEPVHADEARVFEASAGALEVGVANATHGWLRVRAELDAGGGVVAQVVAGNAATEGLHKELPAISAYLAQEQVGLSSLVIHAAGAAAGAQDAAAGTTFSFSRGQGGSDASRERGRQDSYARERLDGMMTAMVEGLSAGLRLPAQLYGGGMNGGWLSVRV